MLASATRNLKRRLRSTRTCSSAPLDRPDAWCKPQDLAWAAPVVEEILELYRCKPKPEYYDRYTDDAVFDDPAGEVRGRPGIRLAFEYLAVIFSKGETLDIKVSYHPRLTGSERNTFRDFRGVGREFVPAQARIELTQRYTWNRTTSTISLPSVILLTFNDDQRIVRHEDRWFGRTTTLTLPMIGVVHGAAKRMNGLIWERMAASRGWK